MIISFTVVTLIFFQKKNNACNKGAQKPTTMNPLKGYTQKDLRFMVIKSEKSRTLQNIGIQSRLNEKEKTRYKFLKQSLIQTKYIILHQSQTKYRLAKKSGERQ